MIRDALAVFGLLGVIFVSATLVNAWGSDEVQAPEVQAPETPEGQIFATEPFELEPGLAIVALTHRGEGDFTVDLLSTGQGEASRSERVEFSGDESGGDDTGAAFAIADETGLVDISTAVKIPAAGEYVFQVEADGPWTIEVEQPDPSSVTDTTSFSGDYDTATPLFRLSSGPKKINVTNPTGGTLEVSLLDRRGNELATILGTGADQAGSYPPDESPVTIDIPESGAYLFDVRADGLWTIEITEDG